MASPVAPEGATWAHRSLPQKNKLAAADACTVETALQAEPSALAIQGEEGLSSPKRTDASRRSSGSDSNRKPS
jgi:hypothetical protein